MGGSTIPLSWAVMTMAHHCLRPPTPTRHRSDHLRLALNRPSTPWTMAPRCRRSNHSHNRSIFGTGPCPVRGNTPRPVGVQCMAPPWSTTIPPRQPTMMANHWNVVILEIPGHRPCPLHRRPTTTMRTTTACPRRLSSTSPPPTLRTSFKNNPKNAPKPAKWPPPLQCLTTSTVGAPSRST